MKKNQFIDKSPVKIKWPEKQNASEYQKQWK